MENNQLELITPEQASNRLGLALNNLMRTLNFPNYDYKKLVSEDSKLGIHWSDTLNKLTTLFWHKLTEQDKIYVLEANLSFTTYTTTNYPVDSIAFVLGMFSTVKIN